MACWQVSEVYLHLFPVSEIEGKLEIIQKLRTVVWPDTEICFIGFQLNSSSEKLIHSHGLTSDHTLDVGFEVSAAGVVNVVIFWDIVDCSP